MYRFRIEYYVKYRNHPQRALFEGVNARNFADAQNKALRVIKRKHPTSAFNVWQITKVKKFGALAPPVSTDITVSGIGALDTAEISEGWNLVSLAKKLKCSDILKLRKQLVNASRILKQSKVDYDNLKKSKGSAKEIEIAFAKLKDATDLYNSLLSILNQLEKMCEPEVIGKPRLAPLA